MSSFPQVQAPWRTPQPPAPWASPIALPRLWAFRWEPAGGARFHRHVAWSHHFPPSPGHDPKAAVPRPLRPRNLHHAVFWFILPGSVSNVHPKPWKCCRLSAPRPCPGPAHTRPSPAPALHLVAQRFQTPLPASLSTFLMSPPDAAHPGLLSVGCQAFPGGCQWWEAGLLAGPLHTQGVCPGDRRQ